MKQLDHDKVTQTHLERSAYLYPTGCATRLQQWDDDA